MVATPDPEPEHDSKPEAKMATGTENGNRPDCPHYMSQKNGGLSAVGPGAARQEPGGPARTALGATAASAGRKGWGGEQEEEDEEEDE